MATGILSVACSGTAETDSAYEPSELRGLPRATFNAELSSGDGDRAGESKPIYSYAEAIRESIWVTTELDNDGDGQKDRVAVDLVRPREAAEQGLKVPVILEASPYYQELGRGNEDEIKSYDANGVISKMPLFYDNYFVPRGYAFVSVDLAGTNRSSGCMDVGGREDILGAKAVIDWLNGRATAARADGTPVLADWTTGKVGMIGKSWDGTTANGVAATGVEGLVTIVPIASISNWYVYTRAEGTRRYEDHMGALHNFVNGRPAGVCDATLARLRSEQDDATGNYNDFFAERNYVPDVSRVRASVFVHHGIDDWNVTTPQFAAWWKALAARGVPRKLWLSQGAHVDPFDNRRTEWVSTLHRWFDYWLQGRQNGIMREPLASIEQTPGHWVNERTWPARGARDVRFRLGDGDGTTGTLALPWEAGARDAVRTFKDNPALTEPDATSEPNTAKDGRVVFLSNRLRRGIRISGTPKVKLRVRVDKPSTEITARIVDYGTAVRSQNYYGSGLVNLTTESCWGESTATDDACYLETAQKLAQTDFGVLTRGWIDAAHRHSLASPSPLRPNEWYSVTVPLDAEESVIPAGHVVGLVIAATDGERTNPLVANRGATITVDLDASYLQLPMVDAPAEDVAADALAPHVIAPRPAETFAAQPIDKNWFLSQFR